MTKHGTFTTADAYFVVAGGEWYIDAEREYRNIDVCEAFASRHSFAVICGKQNGDVEVMCESLTEPPPPLTGVPDGWEEAMEVSVNTVELPVLIETGNFGFALDAEPLIGTLGWTRFRVLANGRAAARVDDTLPESFSITAWAEPGDREPVKF